MKNYLLLDKVVSSVVKRLPAEDDWYGINRYGIDLAHFTHGNYKNLKYQNDFRETIQRKTDDKLVLSPAELIGSTMSLRFTG